MAGQAAALQYPGPQAAATKAGTMTEVRWGILGAANFARHAADDRRRLCQRRLSVRAPRSTPLATR
jgi:hypothetical protein